LISLRGGFCGVGDAKCVKCLSYFVGNAVLEAVAAIAKILKLLIVAASTLKSD
jgi:hypothetical protein